ncbi:hypothetical protein F5X98DRAFT_225157 [Xylaria grammica]|nr:hypothetical protein F5X98DRAFT_225157 [Xylaria grammica]
MYATSLFVQLGRKTEINRVKPKKHGETTKPTAVFHTTPKAAIMADDGSPLGRKILLTEEMDVHLVWTTGRMFLKPIPHFPLEPQFWC